MKKIKKNRSVYNNHLYLFDLLADAAGIDFYQFLQAI
jgi:hypothetical protein